jgi:hypothetical protein
VNSDAEKPARAPEGIGPYAVPSWYAPVEPRDEAAEAAQRRHDLVLDVVGTLLGAIAMLVLGGVLGWLVVRIWLGGS